MKQNYINEVMKRMTVSTDLIKKRIEDFISFPIFVTKQTITLDEATNNCIKSADFVCSKCNHKYSIIGTPDSQQVCANCGNEDSYFLAQHLPSFDGDFTTNEIIVKTIPAEEKPDAVCKANILYNGYNTALQLSTSRPLFLNEFKMDGESIFALIEYEPSFTIDGKKGFQELLFIPTNNLMIFAKDEIVALRNGKKTTSSLEKIFANRYHERDKLFIAEPDIAKNFFDFIKGYQANATEESSIVDVTNDHNLYFVHLLNLDTLAKKLSKAHAASKPNHKKQQLIEHILNAMPIPDAFEEDTDLIFYTVKEIDEIAKTRRICFECPDCGGTNDIYAPQYGSFIPRDREYAICNQCGIVLPKERFTDIMSYTNRKVIFYLIQDMGEDVVIYDASYICSAKEGKLYYTPDQSHIGQMKNNIIVIRKDFDKQNLMANTVILRSTYEKGNKYSIAKNFKVEYSTAPYQNIRTRNTATNFNLQWSAIDTVFEDSTYPSLSISADTLAAFVLLYRKYPVVEKLAKENQAMIICDILKNYDWKNGKEDVAYDLTQNDVASALRISKGVLRILNDGEYKRNKTHTCRILQMLYTLDPNITLENYKYITAHSISAHRVADVCRRFGFTIHQICEYLERVRLTQCVHPNVAMSEWADYLEGCHTIGSDLSDKRVKYPAALRTEHDKVMYKKKIIDDAQYENRFQEVTEEYGQRYSTTDKDFIITYPKTLQDLFEEGRRLNHCVGSYGDAVKNGDSIILFVRKASAPDTPYFTLEVKPRHNAVTQFYGYSDTRPHAVRDKNLITFTKSWAREHGILWGI